MSDNFIITDDYIYYVYCKSSDLTTLEFNKLTHLLNSEDFNSSLRSVDKNEFEFIKCKLPEAKLNINLNSVKILDLVILESSKVIKLYRFDNKYELASEDDNFKKLIKVFYTYTWISEDELNRVTLDTELYQLLEDLGFDSLDVVEFTMNVESEFNISISDSDVDYIKTNRLTIRNALKRILQ